MDRLTFHDFDEYVAAIQGVNVQMMLNRLVHPTWTFQHFETHGIQIQTGIQGSGDLTVGEAPSEGYTFYLPLNNAAGQHANGKPLNPGSILVFEPGCEFYMNSKVDHSWCTVFIPKSMLLSEPSDSDVSSCQCRVAAVSPKIARRFYVLIDRLCSAVNGHADLASSKALKVPTSELCSLSHQA